MSVSYSGYFTVINSCGATSAIKNWDSLKRLQIDDTGSLTNCSANYPVGNFEPRDLKSTFLRVKRAIIIILC